MTMAIQLHEIGGPENLKWEEVEVGDPGEGEVRIRHTAIGLNFQDCNRRAGRFPVPGLPVILGGEGAGVVEAVGPPTLMMKGSLTLARPLARPTVMHYIADPALLNRALEDLFDVVSKGDVRVEIGQTYPLAETARAHADMEARKTHGSTVLLP